MLHLIPYMNKDLTDIPFHFSMLRQISKLLQSGNKSVTLVARHRMGLDWLLQLLNDYYFLLHIVTALSTMPSCTHLFIPRPSVCLEMGPSLMRAVGTAFSLSLRTLIQHPGICILHTTQHFFHFTIMNNTVLL